MLHLVLLRGGGRRTPGGPARQLGRDGGGGGAASDVRSAEKEADSKKVHYVERSLSYLVTKLGLLGLLLLLWCLRPPLAEEKADDLAMATPTSLAVSMEPPPPWTFS